MKDGCTTLEKAEENQNKFNFNINIIKQRDKSEEQKIIKHYTNRKKKLSNRLMIILKLCLKLNTKQDVEKDSKYWVLNKCFKDCQ